MGKFNLALCVECIVSWLGRRTWIPVGSGWMLHRSGGDAVEEGTE